MKDYLFITVIVLLAVFFIVKEIRNDTTNKDIKQANKAIMVKYDSLSIEINQLKKLILGLDSLRVINNNYYTEVINESDSVIKADSNNAYGLVRKQLKLLTDNK